MSRNQASVYLKTLDGEFCCHNESSWSLKIVGVVLHKLVRRLGLTDKYVKLTHDEVH